MTRELAHRDDTKIDSWNKRCFGSSSFTSPWLSRGFSSPFFGTRLGGSKATGVESCWQNSLSVTFPLLSTHLSPLSPPKKKKNHQQTEQNISGPQLLVLLCLYVSFSLPNSFFLIILSRRVQNCVWTGTGILWAGEKANQGACVDAPFSREGTRGWQAGALHAGRCFVNVLGLRSGYT